MGEWSYLERMGSSEEFDSDRNVSMIASAALDARTIVAAVKNADNRLQVIRWELFEDGSVKRAFISYLGDPTSGVGICVLGQTRFVTASRIEGNKLELTTWDYNASTGFLYKRFAKRTKEEVHENFAIATVRGEEIAFDHPSVGIGHLVVTAVRENDDNLKLISWRINWDGTIDRIDEYSNESGNKIREISAVTYDSFPLNKWSLATAVTFDFMKPGHRTPYPRLKVISWRIDPDGSITKQGQEFGNDESATDLKASPLGHRCTITSYKKSNGILVVQKWYFDGSGNVIPGPQEKTAGTVTDHSLSTQNTTRIFTAVGNSNGYLKIILWDATSDRIVRLKSKMGGAIKIVSIVTLGADWICTLVVDKEGGLKAIAWREHSVSLLRGEWDAGTTTTLVEKSTRANVPLAGVEPEFADGSGTKDPMIAVGFNYVIASQDHGIIFLDKQGNKLPPKYPGQKRAITTSEFFSTFTTSTLGSGARNDNCIHRHMGFSPEDNMFYPPGHGCDPESAGSPHPPPCIDEFYDTRVHFDPNTRRFFIFAPCRGCKEVSVNGNCDSENGINGNQLDNPLNRRYFAIAVSKTEDPRDGFYQWLSTEAYVADAPEFTVNQGVMVISKVPSNINRNPFGFRPLIYVLSVYDLIEGKAYPRSHKFFKKDIPDYKGGELSPLTHFGNTHGRIFFISRTPDKANEINLYSFVDPNGWTQVGSFWHSTATLPIDIGDIVDNKNPLWLREHPVFRNDKIYFTWMKWEEGRFNLTPARYSIHIIRLPLDGTMHPLTSPADGFFHWRIPGEHDDELEYSVEEPTIAVKKNGTMIILYGRIGYKSVHYPQARYAYIRANDTIPYHDELIKQGEDNPWESDADGNLIIPIQLLTPHTQMDYHTAVIDPHDDKTVWMITEFVKDTDDGQGVYRTIISTNMV